MSFTSFSFLVFFSLVYVILWVTYFLFHKRKSYPRINQVLLVFFSYAFLTWADYRFSICILLLSLVVYFCALEIEKKGRVYFAIGLSVCILQLFVFKYFDFFVSSFSSLFSTQSHILKLFIPLGVSFYTFSCISYLVDVYGKKIYANHSFLEVALYVSFFPKLISGPIVRPNSFFNQLSDNIHVSKQNLSEGIQIVVCGLFKKMVLADHICVFTDNVFTAPSIFSSGTLVLAVIGYALQIYFDFSGYSDIAIGLSKMIGFSFDKNFNLPYTSKNPSEFWKRWHISLSSWLKDYIYIPLGGNRKGEFRTCLNLFLTMLIGGLWHGANWTFVIWGGLNGIALIVHKMLCRSKKQIFNGTCTTDILSMLINFIFVCFLWIFFRSESLEKAFLFITTMFSHNEGVSQPFSWVFIAIFFLMIELVYSYFSAKKNQTPLCQKYLILNLKNVIQLAIFFFFIGIIIITGYFGNTTFIYAAF